MTTTPSKFASLKHLLACQVDHGLTAKGREYQEEELADLIMRKAQQKADVQVNNWTKGFAHEVVRSKSCQR